MKKKTLVLGLGISGKSAAVYLLRQGIQVVGVDGKALQLQPEYPFEIFDDKEDISLEGVDCIVKSPGISWEHPLLKKAKEKKVAITSEMELALLALKDKGKTLFAITGSNGKTTTTLLTTHILNACGKKALAVGNVGRAILSEIDSPFDHFVVELSSFQLETLELQVFDAACICNITPNHLDRYGCMEEYARAKFRVARCLKPEGRLFLHKEVTQEFGYLIDAQMKEKVATIFPLRYRHGESVIAAHDLENLGSAFALTSFLGVEEEEFWQAFSTFSKPPHRIEFVRLHHGVRYVNDSKATSSDAMSKAIESMEGDVILIAGGLDKKGDFQSLKPLIKKKVKALLLIGSSAEKIERELHDVVSIEISETIDRAVMRAKDLAKPGENVLFSPGCASYDQFNNYEHRGEVFKQLVKEL